MSFPRYPEYKDSGSQWLGEVPQHWNVTKLSHISNRIGSGKTPTGGAQAYVSSGITFIRSQNVHDDGLRLDDVVFINEATDKEMAWSRVQPLDVLLNITGASIGRSCLVPASFKRANVNQHVCVIRLEQPESLAEWVAWAMKSTPTKSQVDIHQTGAAREGLNFEQLSSFRICIPPDGERRKITGFLDHETAKIDTLIHEQKRLIELLKEKRQAVISHAVTKGLDPDVPMKDSGVEWLGEVPAHWEVKPLRHLGECQNGINIGGEAFGSGEPFVSYGDVFKNAVLPDKVLGLVESTKKDRQRYSVLQGDVLFTRTSEIVEEVGFSSTCLRDLPKAVFAGFLIRFRPTPSSILPDYSKFYFRSEILRSFFNKEMNLVTRASLSQDLLKLLPVTLPPINEQADIATYLHNKTKQYDSLVEEGRKSIDLLKERRAALISAAVTGKIDVGNWKPPADESAFDEEFLHSDLEQVS